MPRIVKSQDELEAMIMKEAPSSVVGVLVTADADSWRVVALGRDGETMRLQEVEKIAERLRGDYDLAA